MVWGDVCDPNGLEIGGGRNRGCCGSSNVFSLLPCGGNERFELANEVVARQLSVRDVESRAREIASNTTATHRSQPQSATAPSSNADPAVRRIEEQLRQRLQTDVAIQIHGNDRGVVRVSFYSHDDLERVLDLVLGKGRSDFD